LATGATWASVVFPQAALKVFLTASAEARAERRYKQLIEKGLSANLPDLLLDLQQRDERDSQRGVAPLRQEEDARLLDTTELTIEQAVKPGVGVEQGSIAVRRCRSTDWRRIFKL
jgi:3-phosphoshikimate 1-carboxyvinyltransferase